MIRVDNDSFLKVCKKHGTKPRLVEKLRDPYASGIMFPIPRMHYVCDACETEKQLAEHQPLIDAWNRKQDE